MLRTSGEPDAIHAQLRTQVGMGRGSDAADGLGIQPTNGIAGLYGITGIGNLFNPGVLKGTSPTSLDFVSGDTGKNLYNNDWNNFAPFIGIATLRILRAVL